MKIKRQRINNHIPYIGGLLITSLVAYCLYLLSFNFSIRTYYYHQLVQPVNVQEDSFDFLINSRENYLAIISSPTLFKFNQFGAHEIQISIFNENSETPIQTNTYNAFDFVNSLNVPIGFPIQEDSKNRAYLIRVNAICNNSNACSIQPQISELTIKHYLPKTYLLSNWQLPFQQLFINIKTTNWNILLTFLIIPIAIYFLVFTASKMNLFASLKKYLRKNLKTHYLFIYLLIFIDLFIQTNWSYFLCLIIMLFLMKQLKFLSSVTFHIINIFIMSFLTTLLLIGGLNSAGERLSLWMITLFISFIICLIYFSDKILQD